MSEETQSGQEIQLTSTINAGDIFLHQREPVGKLLSPEFFLEIEDLGIRMQERALSVRSTLARKFAEKQGFLFLLTNEHDQVREVSYEVNIGNLFIRALRSQQRSSTQHDINLNDAEVLLREIKTITSLQDLISEPAKKEGEHKYEIPLRLINWFPFVPLEQWQRLQIDVFGSTLDGKSKGERYILTQEGSLIKEVRWSQTHEVSEGKKHTKIEFKIQNPKINAVPVFSITVEYRDDQGYEYWYLRKEEETGYSVSMLYPSVTGTLMLSNIFSLEPMNLGWKLRTGNMVGLELMKGNDVYVPTFSKLVTQARGALLSTRYPPRPRTTK